MGNLDVNKIKSLLEKVAAEEKNLSDAEVNLVCYLLSLLDGEHSVLIAIKFLETIEKNTNNSKEKVIAIRESVKSLTK